MKHVSGVMLQRFAAVLVAIGLLAATAGNVLLMASCSADKAVRRYEAANIALNLTDAATTYVGIKQKKGHEAMPATARLYNAHPEAVFPVKIAAALIENKLCRREQERGNPHWRVCFAGPLIINGALSLWNLRIVF